MDKRITELVFILDKSGSMERIRGATITNFNELLDAQKADAHGDEARISVYSFNQALDKVCFRAPLDEARPLTEETYVPNGMTALNDAVCTALNEITDAEKDNLAKERKIVHIVCIITDGLENASKEYNGQTVKKLVEDLRKQGWTFTYMGANQDSVEVAFTLSIRNARNFDYSEDGAMYAMAKDTSTRMELFSRIHNFRMENQEVDACMSNEERNELYASMADEAFDEIQ